MSDKLQKNKMPASLLKWYEQYHRDLPWRAALGAQPNPYHVWLSEIMLQQTIVVTVKPYFEKFINQWPCLEDLAQANIEDILRFWAGLGYYRRAHLLHKCAGEVMALHGGRFPEDEAALLQLSGIGPYTAAAITAIAFGKRANVVDGNVERVMARLFTVQEALPKAKPILKRHAASMLPSERYGDYAQALMDLGAMICTPRSPKCDLCPWKRMCQAHKEGHAEAYPHRAPQKKKPHRKATAFVLLDPKERVLLRKRDEKGLLAGMTAVPMSVWEEAHRFSFDEAPLEADWHWVKGRVRHVFTHFELEVRVAVASYNRTRKIKGRWVASSALADEALPSLMRKILKHAKIGA
ncbi:MAG: A/G-specific adenine glycosylase [Bdellovibrionales bacterium]